MQFVKKLEKRNNNFYDNPPVVIACIGDSVTHGCFDVFLDRFGEIDTRYEVNAGYVGQWRERLETLYPAAAPVMVNAGISGDNATNGLKRLERDVLRFRPDVVTVNFGLNDSTNPDVESGCRQYAQAMKEIFRRVLDSGAECILLTPNHMCCYLLPEVPDGKLREAARACMISQNDGILSRYVESAREAARETGAVIADAYAKWDALERAGVDTTKLLANRINHPTKEMHGLFVEALMEAMLTGRVGGQ